MSLLTLNKASLTIANKILLDKVDCQIHQGEHIGLLGRNGEGKSTLLRVIAGELELDGGEIRRAPGLKIGFLDQQVPDQADLSIYDVVAKGLHEAADLVRAYHECTRRVAEDPTPTALSKLQQYQVELEQKNGWQLQQRVEAIISRFGFAADALFKQLSGGMQRRVLLAQALVDEPDLLLLDEPTNHLDIAAIEWLETFLKNYQGTVLCITHDRRFLQAITQKVFELDRGQLVAFAGDYKKFLDHKQHLDEVEQEQNKLFDKKLAQEEAWIRQGIKARRTRNEGRVRNLHKLREVYAQRRSKQDKAQATLHEAELSGKQVVRAKNITCQYDDKTIVRDFTIDIVRGDKIGIVGPNGCGKTTLLNCLLGEKNPEQGTVKIGTNCQIAYFDQMRDQLDDNLSIQDNVGEGSDAVVINGKSKHILGYLQEFLFTPEQSRAPIKKLSGGERNRVLLAKLFTKPANVFVLDEPTNDLDIETLELLEERLLEFNGTVIVVSHDREFLNNVVTSTIAYLGDGKFCQFIGGYDDYLRQKPAPTVNPVAEKKPEKLVKALTRDYQSEKELRQIPQKIEKLEARKHDLQMQMAAPDFYQQESQKSDKIINEFNKLEEDLERLYQRWEELDSQ